MTLSGCAVFAQEQGRKVEIGFGGDFKPPLNSETKTETKQEAVAFETQNQDDSSMLEGTTQVQQAGVNGAKEVVYSILMIGGKEVKRTVASEKVTTPPVPQVVLVGTTSPSYAETQPSTPAERPPPRVVIEYVPLDMNDYCPNPNGGYYYCGQH